MKKFAFSLILIYLLLGFAWLVAGSWLIRKIADGMPGDDLQYLYDIKNLLFLVISIVTITLIVQHRYSRLLLKEQVLNRQLLAQEAEVQQLLQDYRYVNKATKDCVWDYDIVKDELKWVSGYEELFGYEDGAVIKDAFWSMQKIHPEDRERVAGMFQSLLQTKEREWAAEYRYLCADGNYKYVADRGYMILNDDLIPVRMLGAMQDIHQVKTYQQQLESQNDKLKEIAWLNSHEVRRPLCNITGIIPIIKECIDDQENLPELIKALEVSAGELDQAVLKVNEGLLP